MRADVARDDDAPMLDDATDAEDRLPLWDAGGAGPGSVLGLARLRVTRGGGLALAVAFGMLVAVVLICTVPLYNALVTNLQLEHAVTSGPPVTRNVWIDMRNQRVSPVDRTDEDPVVDRLGHQYLAGFTAAAPTFFVQSSELLLEQAGTRDYLATPGPVPQVTFEAFDYASIARHMRFSAGGPPQTTPADAQPQVIVTQEMADSEGVHVGDNLVTAPLNNRQQTLTLHVVGIWTPLSATDPFWNDFSFQANGSATAPIIYPILVTYDTFFNRLSAFPNVSMDQNWFFYTQPTAITSDNLGAVAGSIGDLRAHLSGYVQPQPNVNVVNVLTGLDTTLQALQAQQALLALPLYVVVAQMVALALLFVAAMAGLLVEARGAEVVTLKSRGGSAAQLLLGFGAQGALLALLAAVAGPFLAALLSLALIHWLIPAEVLGQTGVTASYLQRIATPRTVVIPAAAGALLGVGVLTVSIWQATRLDMQAFHREQGRVSRPPFWRRSYLDLALVALCLAGYVELNQFGALQTRTQLAGGAASPLLLVTPALLLLAGGLVMLRLLPVAAAWATRLAARARGLTSLLAFAQVERSPSRYTRMTLLLVLAVGLGLFALTFDTSLAQNQTASAAYAVGANVRIEEDFGLTPEELAPFQQQLARLPSVLAVSPAYRTQATFSGGSNGSVQTDVLGIDPDTFGQVAGPVSWSDSYASVPLNALLSQLRSHTQGATARTPQAPIWTIVSSAFAAQNHLKVGDTFTVELTEDGFSPTTLQVGRIVSLFPTLYPHRLLGSFIVVNMNDYLATVAANAISGGSVQIGPNEFWLRTSGGATQEAALAQALPTPPSNAQSVMTLDGALAAANANPVGAGMRGLLLVGALTAALLAIIGNLAQSAVAVRQRVRQFAVLRTLGMSPGQIVRMLLAEQSAVYLFGLVGGTLLGLVLVTATLPFLEFSSAAIDTSTLGVPPYQIAFNVVGMAGFYGALL
ncbi:MAG TPA: ABC transporter permease, partial [Ktedonobacterales bacterium]|nr:ABC transporter permease [Ktedonobacterales bacterium]